MAVHRRNVPDPDSGASDPLSLAVTEKRLTADPPLGIPQSLTFAPSDSPEFEVGDAASTPKTYNTAAGAGVQSPPGRSHPPVRT